MICNLKYDVGYRSQVCKVDTKKFCKGGENGKVYVCIMLVIEGRVVRIDGRQRKTKKNITTRLIDQQG